VRAYAQLAGLVTPVTHAMSITTDQLAPLIVTLKPLAMDMVRALQLACVFVRASILLQIVPAALNITMVMIASPIVNHPQHAMDMELAHQKDCAYATLVL
jgi:hypothetical protein